MTCVRQRTPIVQRALPENRIFVRWQQRMGVNVKSAVCARCDEPSTTVVAEISGLTLYMDVCQEHLAELLEGARPLGPDRPRALTEPRVGP